MYPPNALATNRQNSTPTADTHPGDHDLVNAAVNSVVKVLGDAGVLGPFETNGSKYADVKAVLQHLFDENKQRIADITGLDAVHSIRSGAGAPSAGTGHVGDWYINTTQYTLYGPKSKSATNPWGSPVTLVGPKGADSTVPGPQGAPGVNGTNGKDGKDGAIAQLYDASTAMTVRPGINFVGAAVSDDGVSATVVSVVTEPFVLFGETSGTFSLDVSASTGFAVGAPSGLTGPATIAFTNAPGGSLARFVIEVWQGATAQAITWPAGMHWNGETSPGGAAPAMNTANGLYVVVVNELSDGSYMGTVAVSGKYA